MRLAEAKVKSCEAKVSVNEAKVQLSRAKYSNRSPDDDAEELQRSVQLSQRGLETAHSLLEISVKVLAALCDISAAATGSEECGSRIKPGIMQKRGDVGALFQRADLRKCLSVHELMLKILSTLTQRELYRRVACASSWLRETANSLSLPQSKVFHIHLPMGSDLRHLARILSKYSAQLASRPTLKISGEFGNAKLSQAVQACKGGRLPLLGNVTTLDLSIDNRQTGVRFTKRSCVIPGAAWKLLSRVCPNAEALRAGNVASDLSGPLDDARAAGLRLRALVVSNSPPGWASFEERPWLSYLGSPLDSAEALETLILDHVAFHAPTFADPDHKHFLRGVACLRGLRRVSLVAPRLFEFPLLPGRGRRYGRELPLPEAAVLRFVAALAAASPRLAVFRGSLSADGQTALRAACPGVAYSHAEVSADPRPDLF